jgi:hypothetical protein
MQGTIERAEGKTSKNGKPYMSLTIDGKTYSLWETIPGLVKGAKVDFESSSKEFNGKTYLNIKNIVVLGMTDIDDGLKTAFGDKYDRVLGNTYELINERTQAIIEQNAVTNEMLLRVMEKLGIEDLNKYKSAKEIAREQAKVSE